MNRFISAAAATIMRPGAITFADAEGPASAALAHAAQAVARGKAGHLPMLV